MPVNGSSCTTTAWRCGTERSPLISQPALQITCFNKALFRVMGCRSQKNGHLGKTFGGVGCDAGYRKALTSISFESRHLDSFEDDDHGYSGPPHPPQIRRGRMPDTRARCFSPARSFLHGLSRASGVPQGSGLRGRTRIVHRGRDKSFRSKSPGKAANARKLRTSCVAADDSRARRRTAWHARVSSGRPGRGGHRDSDSADRL
jgi:hypothetical protein